MSDLTLVIGNRNFSSWSMRAWLALALTGAPFEVKQIWIDEDDDRRQRRSHAPTGKVPVLFDGELAIWESLAIAEYLAESFPEAGLWPADRASRARARTLCSEMHAGFPALRTRLPMNCREVKPYCDRGPEVDQEVARIREMWSGTRSEFGAGGPYLFGERSLAEAFFAPIASRLRTYSIPLDGPAGEYRDAVLALPEVEQWMRLAAQEEHTIEQYASMT